MTNINKIILVVLTCLFLVPSVHAALTDGIFAYFSFSNITVGNFTYSDNGNNSASGKFYGAINYDIGGKLGTGVRDNSTTGSYIAHNNTFKTFGMTSDQTGTGTATWNAWILPTSSNFIGMVMGDTSEYATMEAPLGGNYRCVFYDGGFKTADSGIAVVQGYTMITCVYYNKTFFVYVNGTLKANSVSSSIGWGGENWFAIGGNARTGNVGYIDEVGLWKRNLSASEISQLYNSGTGLNPFAPLGDTVAPNITQISPLNNTNSTTQTITFNCTVSDNENITELSLYTNTTGTWKRNASTPMSGTYNNSAWTLTIPNGNNYQWACMANDTANFNITGNFSFNVSYNVPALVTNESNLTTNATVLSSSPYVQAFCNVNSSNSTANISYEWTWFRDGVSFSNGSFDYNVVANNITMNHSTITPTVLSFEKAYDGNFGTNGTIKPASETEVWIRKRIANDNTSDGTFTIQYTANLSNWAQYIELYCYTGSNWLTTATSKAYSNETLTNFTFTISQTNCKTFSSEFFRLNFYNSVGAGDPRYIAEFYLNEIFRNETNFTFVQGKKVNLVNLSTTIDGNYTFSCRGRDVITGTYSDWVNSSTLTITNGNAVYSNLQTNQTTTYPNVTQPLNISFNAVDNDTIRQCSIWNNDTGTYTSNASFTFNQSSVYVSTSWKASITPVYPALIAKGYWYANCTDRLGNVSVSATQEYTVKNYSAPITNSSTINTNSTVVSKNPLLQFVCNANSTDSIANLTYDYVLFVNNTPLVTYSRPISITTNVSSTLGFFGNASYAIDNDFSSYANIFNGGTFLVYYNISLPKYNSAYRRISFTSMVNNTINFLIYCKTQTGFQTITGSTTPNGFVNDTRYVDDQFTNNDCLTYSPTNLEIAYASANGYLYEIFNINVANVSATQGVATRIDNYSVTLSGNYTLGCRAMDYNSSYFSEWLNSSTLYVTGGVTVFSNNVTNETETYPEGNETINLSVTLQDDDLLSFCVLETNDTATWVNGTNLSGLNVNNYNASFEHRTLVNLSRVAYWKVLCVDEFGNNTESSLYTYWVKHVTGPEIRLGFNNTFNESNTTVISPRTYDLYVNVTYFDLNLFNVNASIDCDDAGRLFSYEILDINTTTWNVTASIDLNMSLKLQRCLFTTYAGDDHTRRNINNYDYSVASNSLWFTTAEGNLINITGDENQSEIDHINTERGSDRYNFDFWFKTQKRHRVFFIESDNPIYFRPNTEYYGHFVIWNKETGQGNWLDFREQQINNRNFYNITRISAYKVRVDIDTPFNKRIFRFKSVGGLNINNLSYEFYFSTYLNLSSLNVYDNKTITNVTALLVPSATYFTSGNLSKNFVNTSFIDNVSNGTYTLYFTSDNGQYFNKSMYLEMNNTPASRNFSSSQGIVNVKLRHLNTTTYLFGLYYNFTNLTSNSSVFYQGSATENYTTFYLNNGTYNLTVTKTNYLPYNNLFNLSYVQNLTIDDEMSFGNNSNLVIRDENNDSIIDYTTTYVQVITTGNESNANSNYTSSTGNFYINLTLGVEYEIRYRTDKHNERVYYATGSYFNNYTLYLLLNETAYNPIVIRVRDEKNERVSNAQINVYRFFTNTTEPYRIVAMKKTNSNGEVNFDLELLNPYYKFHVIHNNQLKYVDDPTQIFQTSWVYYISTVINYLESWYAVDNVYTQLTFNNLTNKTRFEWVDTNNVIDGMCLRVDDNDKLYGITRICNNCSTGISGVLFCNVPSEKNHEYIISVYADTTYQFTNRTIQQAIISFYEKVVPTVQMWFWVGLLIFAAILLGITGGLTGLIIMAIFVLNIISKLGFIVIPRELIMVITLLGAIVILFMRMRVEDS